MSTSELQSELQSESQTELRTALRTALPTAPSTPEPTVDQMEEFIDELLITDQTDFINTLIQDCVIPRSDIHFNNIDNENEEWYYVRPDYCDFKEMLRALSECNITHTVYKYHIWIGTNIDFDKLYKDESWIKLYKMI